MKISASQPGVVYLSMPHSPPWLCRSVFEVQSLSTLPIRYASSRNWRTREPKEHDRYYLSVLSNNYRWDPGIVQLTPRTIPPIFSDNPAVSSKSPHCISTDSKSSASHRPDFFHSSTSSKTLITVPFNSPPA